jgi:hypothetical protein
MKPYYEDGVCTIYHGDCRDWAGDAPGVVLTDPPFGIAYESGAQRLEGNARSIEGDESTAARDTWLQRWGAVPSLVFGSPRAPEPDGVRARLIWDQDGALGMGDLSLPWKPSWQFIYVLGGPWAGRRDCGSVVRYPPVQSVARLHPHEKPVGLLQILLGKCVPGTVVDPFMGSGSTLVAAKAMNREAIGIELSERYCEIAAKRLAQEVLDFGMTSTPQ